MDHLTAIDNHYAERYLLKELSDTDVEEFELHYFECEECAEAVEMGNIFIAASRDVMKETGRRDAALSAAPAPVSFRDAVVQWWRRPFVLVPLAASFLLAAVALYQGAVVIPSLRQSVESARALPAFQLIGASRGDASQLVVPAGASSFALSADIPPDAHASQYMCVLSYAGTPVFRIAAPAPAAGQPVTLLVPSKGLRDGSYDLAIFAADSSGQQKEKVVTFSFGLQFH